jgi:methionyl-tRNA synthetase
MKQKYYVTSAIPYANDNPHIGHALLFLYADVIARYQRLAGKDVYFLIGTDEHGQKMFRAANEKGVPVAEYCNQKSAVFQNLADQWNISNNDFIRTTDERHIQSAQKFWMSAEKSGDIYKKKYSGLYCVGCESFKTEKDLVDGKCPDHQKEPEWLEEENYFFRLSKYQDKLEKLFKKNPSFVYPENRYNEMLNILKNGLEDISISRSTQKLTWGIPVPGDLEQVMYVWFDALTNYVTALGYGSEDETLFKKYWPADVHVLGKEINRFHSLLWPAMLMSAGVELPKMIAAHGWITVNGQKMSKSVGNVIDPIKMADKYPIESIRYFFMKELAFDSDGDYSDEKFEARYNGDLANGLGNLVNRVTVMIEKYSENLSPKIIQPNQVIVDSVSLAWKNYSRHMNELYFNRALDAVWKLITDCDVQISELKPWTWAKNNEFAKINDLLGSLSEALRHIAIMIYPIMPDTSHKIIGQIGLTPEKEYAEPLIKLQEWRDNYSTKITPPEPLFMRLEK